MVAMDVAYLQSTRYAVVAAGVGVGTAGDLTAEVLLLAIADVTILVKGTTNALIATGGVGATVAVEAEATVVVATEETGKVGGTGNVTGTEKVGGAVVEAGGRVGDLLATVAVEVEA